MFTFWEDGSEWTPGFEKEFRRLALAEATGSLAPEQAARLEKLSGLRDRFLNPSSPDEILLQLKRDRILGKMAEGLSEYVEFLETTGHKGTRTS